VSEYDALLRESDELDKAAKPGPWRANYVSGRDHEGHCVEPAEAWITAANGEKIAEWYEEYPQGGVSPPDQHDIARARTLVPDLAAALRASEARAEAAEESLRESQRLNSDGAERYNALVDKLRRYEEGNELAWRVRAEAAEKAIQEVLPLLENAEYEVGRRYYGDDIRLEAALECLEKSIKILKEKVK
jgi:tetratricopeptide (TPR) repeat protein